MALGEPHPLTINTGTKQTMGVGLSSVYTLGDQIIYHSSAVYVPFDRFAAVSHRIYLGYYRGIDR